MPAHTPWSSYLASNISNQRLVGKPQVWHLRMLLQIAHELTATRTLREHAEKDNVPAMPAFVLLFYILILYYNNIFFLRHWKHTAHIQHIQEWFYLFSAALYTRDTSTAFHSSSILRFLSCFVLLSISLWHLIYIPKGRAPLHITSLCDWLDLLDPDMTLIFWLLFF